MEVWEKAVSAPDCSRGDLNLNQSEFIWQPDHLIRAYHTTTSSQKAIALVKENSPENDLLLLPSTGGWEAAMSAIRVEQIIEDYPSMLEQPWRKAVGLQLKVMTRRETDGRQDKEITEVAIAPMFGPEYRHYNQKIGIKPQTFVENKLELAPLLAEAKLEPACRYGSLHHPMEKLPAAKLFIAMFTVDLKKLPALGKP